VGYINEGVLWGTWGRRGGETLQSLMWQKEGREAMKKSLIWELGVIGG